MHLIPFSAGAPTLTPLGGGIYDTPPDPLVGGGGEYTPSPSRIRRLDSQPPGPPQDKFLATPVIITTLHSKQLQIYLDANISRTVIQAYRDGGIKTYRL